MAGKIKEDNHSGAGPTAFRLLGHDGADVGQRRQEVKDITAWAELVVSRPPGPEFIVKLAAMKSRNSLRTKPISQQGFHRLINGTPSHYVTYVEHHPCQSHDLKY
jgi:hypothetical protein